MVRQLQEHGLYNAYHRRKERQLEKLRSGVKAEGSEDEKVYLSQEERKKRSVGRKK